MKKRGIGKPFCMFVILLLVLGGLFGCSSDGGGDGGGGDDGAGAPPVNPPTASITSPSSGSSHTTDDTIAFQGSGTDSDGTIASYGWDFGDGSTSTDQNPTHTYSSAGTYTVTLTVTDNDGATGSASISVTITQGGTPPANTPPTAAITSPASGSDYTIADTITFNGNGTDSDGTIASYSWDFGDAATSASQNPTHSYATIGTYTVTLTVTDDDGATGSASISVDIINQPPTSTITSPADGSYFSYADPVSFTGSGTDPDGTIVSYSWDFGDGNTSNDQNPIHTYGSVINPVVTLTVTDNDGGSGVASITLNIVNQPPTAEITGPSGTSALSTDDLIAYYQFKGNAIDLSGNGNHGTVNGAVKASDRFGNADSAYIFDGNSSIDVSDDPTLTLNNDQFTVSSWVQMNAFGADGGYYLMGQSEGPGNTAKWIFWLANNGISFVITEAGGGWIELGTFPFATGQWYHVAVQRSGNQLTAFVNGSSIGSGTVSIPTPNPNAAFQIGTAEGGRPNRLFNGLIDDVRIYNRTLSESEIQTLYSDNGSVYTALDTINFSGTGTDYEDGQLTGASLVWTSDVDGEIGTGETFTKSLTPGIHSITLTATDTMGMSGASLNQLTVRVNQAPTASITSPSEGFLSSYADTVSFTGEGTDPDGIIVFYDWDFGDGTTGTGQNPTHTYVSVQNPTVTLTVTDSDGEVSPPVSITLDIINNAPTVTINTPADGAVFQPADTINFTADCLDYEDGTIPCNWSSDVDGAFGSGGSVQASLSPNTHTITAAITDSLGLSANDSISIRVNQLPTASITSPIDGFSSSYVDAVNFTGSGTDPDGTINFYNWDFGDGNTSNEQNPTHTYASVGPYTVALTVTDNDGGISLSVSISLNIINNTPTVTINTPADGDVFQPVDTINFTADCLDYEDGTIPCNWSSDIDGDLGTGASISVTLQVGVHAIIASAADSLGASANDSISIRINQLPTASITSPIDGFSSSYADAVSFTGEGTDTDGTIDSYNWDFGDGNASSEQNPTHTYVSVGQYTVALTVTDNDGGVSSSVSITIDIINNSPAVAINTPADGDVFQPADTINFSATIGDYEDDVLTCDWTSDKDGLIGTGESISATLSADTHTITLTCVDSLGASANDSISIRANQLPIAIIDSPVNDSTYSYVDSIDFQASGGDSDGTIVSFDWDFGDGTAGTEQNPTHTYSSPDTYTVTLTVTDNDGGVSQSDSINLNIVNNPPTVNITAPSDGSFFQTADTIMFSAIYTDYEDGTLPCNCNWSSDIDGDLGTGASISVILSAGTHIITASATDSLGSPGSDSITINVGSNQPPVARPYPKRYL